MENPETEIEGVIRRLTQTPPSVQRETIEKYFTTDAAFIHPFCRVGSFDGSRLVVRAIYRWYKMMSPHIDLAVDSIAFDSTNLILYVTISQIFRIWFVPGYEAPVTLTTVLNLRQDKFDHKYYIRSQNDLYQTTEFARFAWPFGHLVVWLWQVFATLQCVLLTFLLSPISWLEQLGLRSVHKRLGPGRSDQGSSVTYREHKSSRGVVGPTFIEQPRGSGNFVTAPAFEQR